MANIPKQRFKRMTYSFTYTLQADIQKISVPDFAHGKMYKRATFGKLPFRSELALG